MSHDENGPPSVYEQVAVLSDELRAVAERDATAHGTQTLRALLREMEGWWDTCPLCSRDKSEGHAPNCRLAAALEGRDG